MLVLMTTPLSSASQFCTTSYLPPFPSPLPSSPSCSSSSKPWVGSCGGGGGPLSCKWREGGMVVAYWNLQVVKRVQQQAVREGERASVGAGGTAAAAAEEEEEDCDTESFPLPERFVVPEQLGGARPFSPRTAREGGDGAGPHRRAGTPSSSREARNPQSEFQEKRRTSRAYSPRQGGTERRGSDSRHRYSPRDFSRGGGGEGEPSTREDSPPRSSSESNGIWQALRLGKDGGQDRSRMESTDAAVDEFERAHSRHLWAPNSSSPELESRILWPERRAAMMELQSASDVGVALPRLGGRLEVTDMNAILRRFGRMGRWQDSTVLFEWMRKTGRLSPPTYTSYFSVLGKAGQVERVLKTFFELKDPDVRSNLYIWNSLLSTLVSNGKVDKAFHFFRLLREEGLEPDRITYSTMISGCSKALGGFYKAQELVKEMREKGFKLDSVMYGALINVCAYNHMVEEARATFDEMRAEGFAPNLFHFSSLLNSYSLNGRHEEAEHVLQEIKQSGLKPNKVVFNSLINAYARAKMPKKARETFDEMRDYGLQPDMISYCSLMDAYAKAGQVEEAQKLFDAMKAAGLKPGSNGYSILVSAYGRSGNLSMIKRLSEEIDTIMGSDLDVHLFNSLLKVYCQAGVMDGVMDILRKMDDQPCTPNRITFHILMGYFCKEDLCELAIRTLQDMEARGYPANETSYAILIQGYLKNNRIEDALDLVKQMQRRGTSATKIIYQDIINACISVKMLNQAQELFETMKTSRHIVSGSVLEAYLRAFAEEGRLDVVKDVLNVMGKIEHSPSQELWDLLLFKADERREYDLLKKLLEEPGCVPTPYTTHVLLDRFRASGRTDLVHRLALIQRLEDVS